MKYEKGTFITVPNRDALRGQPATMQALFLWLCSYADENGECYPSRTTLAKDIGATVKTIDTHLKKLEQLGLITKSERVEDNTQKSNLYQLQIVEGGVIITRGGVNNDTRGGEKNNPGGAKKTTYRTKTNELKPIELNKATGEPVGGMLVAEVIKAFETVDPKNKTYYGNTTQRKAASFLVEEYGLEEVRKRISVLPQTNKLAYWPTITTPCQLRDKWVQLEDAAARAKQKQGAAANVAF